MAMSAMVAGGSAVQVPRRLVGAWKALLHMDQMLMAVPTKRHKTEGLITQAAVLARRLKWAARVEWEALLHGAQPEKEGAMSTTSSELQRLRSKARLICTLTEVGGKGYALQATNAEAGILKSPVTWTQLRCRLRRRCKQARGFLCRGGAWERRHAQAHGVASGGHCGWAS